MGLNDFINSSFENALDTMDAEDCAIGDEIKRGVVEDMSAELSLGEGGENNERGLRITFPGMAFKVIPKSVKKAVCRNKNWKITTVDNSPASFTIEVIEPERRRR